jgi:hypothetical protein
MPRIIAVVMLVLVALGVPAAGQQSQEPVLYELLPHDFSGPLIRVCSTPEGICLLPFTIAPGRPCACRRPDGAWVNGVCIR